MEALHLLGFGAGGWGGALLKATLMTVTVTIMALAIGSVFGSLAAWGRLSKNLSARMIAEAYTTALRGVPELLIIYLVYFGGSSVTTAIGQYFGGEGFWGVPPLGAGSFAVGVISGSYQAEVYRGAYLAVSPGEIEAARSMGMPRRKLFSRILAPQILRFSLPGLGNVWQMTLKDSALISVTGLAEIMRMSQTAANSTQNYFLFYMAGGFLYLLMTHFSNKIFNAAEKRIKKTTRNALGEER